jgi:hypothetical protein
MEDSEDEEFVEKFMQPVLMQSYNDKFELPKKGYR